MCPSARLSVCLSVCMSVSFIDHCSMQRVEASLHQVFRRCVNDYLIIQRLSRLSPSRQRFIRDVSRMLYASM